MTILKATIYDVIHGLDGRDRLSTSMTFDTYSTLYGHSFILINKADILCLTALMKYTHARTAENMCGKMVYIAVNKCDNIRAFGNIRGDEFVLPFGKGVKYVTRAEIEMAAE